MTAATGSPTNNNKYIRRIVFISKNLNKSDDVEDETDGLRN